MRICIVTPDLLGPVQNGGIGTSCTFLSYELAKKGHNVTILFTQFPNEVKTDAWTKEYEKRNIHIVIAESWYKKQEKVKFFPNHPPLFMSYIVYTWLIEQENNVLFDIIIFMEWQGNGFYSLHSKKNGLHFKNTVLLVQLHSPTLWHEMYNLNIQKHSLQSITWYMERQSINLADVIISPSTYMLKWCIEKGYTMPKEVCVLPNVLELDTISAHYVDKSAPLSELVFFGRLEYRKGVIEFCDAIDRLLQKGTIPSQVTFLGKFAWVGHEHAGLYLARRSKNWPMPISLIPSYDHKKALEYLSQPGRLAIMPSVADNSPYTVYECLKARIPFIARDTGGIPELIPTKAHTACLCTDNPQSLADKMLKAMQEGIVCPGLAFNEEENRRKWEIYLKKLIQENHRIIENSKNRVTEQRLPKVSLCITHYKRPALLKQAIHSLLAQDYPHFEIILADDGSPDLESKCLLNELEPLFTKRKWKILRLENGFPGKARNAAVRESQGEWLLFFDDDNIAFPYMIRRFVEAALFSKADLVVAMFNVFTGINSPEKETSIQEYFLPLGGIVSYSTVANTIGDATSLIRRSLFESLGGFTEDYGLGHEDFELYLRAVLGGAQVSIIPESLFWYRRHTSENIQNNTNRIGNQTRSLRPFLTELKADIAELAILAHALATDESTSIERCGFAPATLTAEAKRAFVQQDPNSDKSLMWVSEFLSSQGQKKLANQILGFTNKEKNFVLKKHIEPLQQKANKAIINKNYKQIFDYIENIENYIQDKDDIPSFYSFLLEILLNKEEQTHKVKLLREKLCQLLLCIDNLDLHTYLIIAKSFLNDNNIQQGIKLFNYALKESEHIYLHKRPDVQEALNNKYFSCGMEHYILYGKNENIDWPELDEFKLIINNYKKVIFRNCSHSIFKDFIKNIFI